MPEVYLDIAKTTVSNGGSGYTSGASSLKVVSTANGTVTNFTGPFPGTGTFTVTILDAATQTIIKAQLTVTSVTDGTTFAVSSEVAGNASDGDIVVACIVSTRSIDQIRKDLAQHGAYASLPATTEQKQGNQYLCTNSPYQFFYTGSVWQARLHGQDVTVPGPSSNWSQVNFGVGKVTLTDAGGTIGFKLLDTNTLNWRIIVKNTPSTPYHIEFFYRFFHVLSNSQTTGVYFYDGTKLMGVETLIQSGPTLTMRVQKITNVTTDSGSAATASFNGSAVGSGIWMRLGNDGTTLTFDYAIERGDWQQLFSEAAGTFITPTKYGFGGVSFTSVSTNFILASLQAATETT